MSYMDIELWRPSSKAQWRPWAKGYERQLYTDHGYLIIVREVRTGRIIHDAGWTSKKDAYSVARLATREHREAQKLKEVVK